MFDFNHLPKQMIDFTKLRNNDQGFAERLRQNPNFEFFSKINPDTGEQLDGKLKAKLRNLIITIHPSGLVEIAGSLHKFSNGGTHNYDDFTYSRLVQTIGEVATLLYTTPDRLSLHNVEFGVNILLNTSPSMVLDNILNYRFKHTNIDTFDGGGYQKDWKQQNYIVKVYDKTLESGLIANILRFENKARTMKHLKDIKIRTLADLLDIAKLQRLGVKLCQTYAGLIIGENLDTASMSRTERQIYEQGMNPNFWLHLPNRKQRNYYRKRFEEVIIKYGSGLRETVGQLIAEKVGELLKSSDVLPEYHNRPLELGRFTHSNKHVKRPINEKLQSVLFNRLPFC